MYRFILLLPFLGLCLACAGISPQSNPDSSSLTTTSSPPGEAVPVAISSGQVQTGINIVVSPPAASPPPNAEFLGLDTSAANTGAQIHRGQSASVLVCGTGLSGAMQVKISGPPDITIGSLRSVGCNGSSSSLSGIEFDVNVSATAALDARTILLMDAQNDITTFSGGLEVIP